MITYQQEFLAQVKPDIEPLLRQDWEEIEHNKELHKFDPAWELYEALEEINSLSIFTVRSDSNLIGYFVVITMPSLHCRGLTQALCDIIYLDKDYRKGLIGYKLFKFAEDCVREDGADVLYVATTKVNPIDNLMVKLGYNKIETRFEKVL